MPSAVIPSVSQFGTRRVRRSSAALAPPLPATAAMTRASDGTGDDTGEVSQNIVLIVVPTAVTAAIATIAINAGEQRRTR